MYDEDVELLEKIEVSRKKKPELSKFLSKNDLDSFELDMFMQDEE